MPILTTQRTIAVVDGVARGGGNEFVMTCDLAFGTENAAFAQPEIFINIPTGDQSGVTPGRKIGQPSPENAKNLTLRSNATFTAFTKHGAAPRTGITAIAHNVKQKKLIVMVHPDNSGDLSLPSLRNKLLSVGCDNAIFLDGSDLSFLMVEGKFIARPAPSKNKTNVVGIGFKY
ncbi:MAG: hypothetical protein ACI978_000002 [Oleispira sp.]